MGKEACKVRKPNYPFFNFLHSMPGQRESKTGHGAITPPTSTSPKKTTAGRCKPPAAVDYKLSPLLLLHNLLRYHLLVYPHFQQVNACGQAL